MSARTLTVDEYAKLAAKLEGKALDAPQQLKQAHRLLCEGRDAESLTQTEQVYAAAFKGAVCVQIPNEYGWEPGVEMMEKTEAKALKPSKSKKDED